MHDDDPNDDSWAAQRDGAAPDTEDDGSTSPSDAGGGEVADAAGEDAMATSCMVCTTCEQVVDLPATANHIDGNIDYTDVPPAGGDHNPCWLNFGVYDEERPDERWVHNLEHGGVVLLYHCPQGCPAEVAEMKQLVQGREQILLTPYAALPTKFAAVSWGHRLLTDCFDAQQFATFYTDHVDHGPESIKTGPPAAYCPP